MYNFLFDKKTLMLLLAGLGLSGALLFFAGLLVGVQVGLPPASGAVAVQPPRDRPEPLAEPAPVFAPAECPCEPGVQTAALRVEPCPEPEPVEAPPERSVPAPVPVEKREPAVVAAVPVPEPEPAVPVLASFPSPEPEQPETKPEAEPAAEVLLVAQVEEKGLAEAQPAVMRPAGYAVQVGAFRSLENLEKALEELRSRGYEPSVVELPGSRSQVLYTVLIGRYTDRSEAFRAAADFRRREGMAAVVLRVGS
jgi:cell division septation protein DedD